MRGRDAASWREMVLAYQAAGMTNGVRVLLVVMAEHMNSGRYVSVPRSRLAERFGISPRRVTERIQIAHELGLLDTVEKGKPGRTATYQGLFPSGGAHVRTKSRRPLGAVERTIKTAQHGAHGGPPSIKPNGSEAPVSESVGTHQKTRAPRGEEGQGLDHAPGFPSWRLSSENQQQTEPLPRSQDTVVPFETQPTTCEWCDRQLVGPVQLEHGLCNRHWVEWRASLVRSS